jgi:hypothetical protein
MATTAALKMSTAATLQLVCERKLCELLECDKPKRWEASGVLLKDGHYFVVFDDRTEIARISADLQPNPTNGLFGMARDVRGYEGITYNAAKQRYYGIPHEKWTLDESTHNGK